MATLVSTGQITIVDQNDGVNVILSNAAMLVPADATGNVTSFAGASSTVQVIQGGVDITANFTLSKADTSCTSTLASGIVTITALSADVGYIDVAATRSGWPTLTARITVTKAKQGVTGNAGTNATAYWLSRSSSAISANAGGTYSPSTITFTGYAQTGVAAPAAYAGRFVVATSTDGVAFTDVYTSAADESSKSYVPPAGLKAIRCRFYLAGGVVSMLDEETVAVVSDGLGVNLCDATWWSPAATFQWSKAEDVAGETSIVWGAGLKGQAAPLLKCLADSVNHCYQPECSGGGLAYWFPCQTVTGTANTAFIIDSTTFLTGPSSYKITKSSLGTSAQGIACKAIPVVPGQIYTVKVSYKGDTASAGGMGIVIHQAATIPASGAVNETNKTSTTIISTGSPCTTSFTTTTVTYTVPAGINAVSLGIYSSTNAPVNIWVDDPIFALSSMTLSTVGPRQGVEGGYNGTALNAIPINPNKTYRFIIPVKFANGALSSQVYWGPENSTKVCTLNTSTVAVNPYFAWTSDLTDGIWYLMVGYIYPAGSTGATNNDAGIYDSTTGVKVVSGTSFCWTAGTTSCGHRAYQYYADNGSVVYFGSPMVHCIDGSEPMLRTWMAATAADLAVGAVSKQSYFSGLNVVIPVSGGYPNSAYISVGSAITKQYSESTLLFFSSGFIAIRTNPSSSSYPVGTYRLETNVNLTLFDAVGNIISVSSPFDDSRDIMCVNASNRETYYIPFNFNGIIVPGYIGNVFPKISVNSSIASGSLDVVNPTAYAQINNCYASIHLNHLEIR